MTMKLTAGQEAAVVRLRDEWLGVANSTGPADRKRAEDGVMRLRRIEGRREPDFIHWHESPAGIWDELVGVGTDIFGESINSLRIYSMDMLREREPCFELDFGVLHITSGLEERNIQNGVKRAMLEDVIPSWMTPYSVAARISDLFICDFIGQAVDRQFKGRGQREWACVDVAESCCLMYDFERGCVAMERPEGLGFDPGGLLHGDGVPAMVFRDGAQLYFWHGVVIPEMMGKVGGRGWDPRWLLKMTNQTHRLILIETVGYEKVISGLGGRLVSSSAAGGMRLWDVDAGEAEGHRLLNVMCPSTGMEYFLRVPPGIDSCEEARSWTFGKEIDFIKET